MSVQLAGKDAGAPGPNQELKNETGGQVFLEKFLKKSLPKSSQPANIALFTHNWNYEAPRSQRGLFLFTQELCIRAKTIP